MNTAMLHPLQANTKQIAGKSILSSAQKKSSKEMSKNQLSARRRLKKVHFFLPKTAKGRRSMQSLDPNMIFVRRWLQFMTIPLAYELWAFPYRLALGFPSTTSNMFYADACCDALFALDMAIGLITAIPATPGSEEVTSFTGIASNYFSKTFPAQVLPCCLYWFVTPWCTEYFQSICSGPISDDGAEAQASVTPSNEWFQCIIEHFGTQLWVWWASTVPRVVPRFLRLKAQFKGLESNLVRRRVDS